MSILYQVWVLVRKKDISSAWSGIRGLIANPNKKSTQSLVRNHLVHVSESNLITIAGGKWTTYRSMAKDTIDTAIKSSFLCKYTAIGNYIIFFSM